MDSPDCGLVVEDTPRPEDIAAVIDGLAAYNLQHAPPEEYRRLHIFLRTGEGKVVGGLIGATFWGWLYVDRLWVHEALRKQSYGSRLMAAAEQEAQRRGCRHAYVDTMTFQVLPFYERLGYTIFGILEDMPQGCRRYFLQKHLVEPAQPGSDSLKS
jgi:GNAT superfamily N-acetyltransferase